MKKFLFLLTSILFFNCSLETIMLSDTESKGVDDILDFYGGYCEYSIGKYKINDEAIVNFYELKLSQSQILEKFKKDSNFASSNIAYRFYRNLSNDEKSKYSEIRTKLLFENGREKEYIFQSDDLRRVENKITTLDKIVDLIKYKNFREISPFLNDSTVIQYDKQELISNLEKVDSTYGNITDEGFQLFGFREVKYNRKHKKYLMISGIIKRDKLSNKFSIVMDPKLNSDEVISLEYKM